MPRACSSSAITRPPTPAPAMITFITVTPHELLASPTGQCAARTTQNATIRPWDGYGAGLFGYRPENAIVAELFENAGLNAEIAAMKLEVAGLDSTFDPGKCHEVRKRQA